MRESRILVAVGLMVLLAVPALMAAKPGTEPQSDTKLFYLTAQTYRGDGPLTPGVCASGYHMASPWEFRDLSKLEYATDEAGAYIAADQGVGPPFEYGWVRSNSSSNGDQGSRSNCFTWTSTTGTDRGAIMSVGGGSAQPDIYVQGGGCSDSRPVWCMQD